MPWSGRGATLRVDVAPRDPVLFVAGLSASFANGAPLPQSLLPVGLEGCLQRISADAASMVLADAGAVKRSESSSSSSSISKSS